MGVFFPSSTPMDLLKKSMRSKGKRTSWTSWAICVQELLDLAWSPFSKVASIWFNSIGNNIFLIFGFYKTKQKNLNVPNERFGWSKHVGGKYFHIKPDRKSTKTYIMQFSTIFINSFLDEVYELEKEVEDESYSYLKWVYLLIICLILTIAYFIKKYVKRHTGVYKTKGQEISEGNCGVLKFQKNIKYISLLSALRVWNQSNQRKNESTVTNSQNSINQIWIKGP